jgi:DNA-directed RNA polymerase subunit omega
VANLPVEEIERKIGSRYALTVLAGKRARELRDGAHRLVNTDSNNPIIIALQEIHEGKIYPENLDYSAGLDTVVNTPDMIVVGEDDLVDLTDADAAGIELPGAADITGKPLGDSALVTAGADVTDKAATDDEDETIAVAAADDDEE